MRYELTDREWAAIRPMKASHAAFSCAMRPEGGR
jgi:hypothetical protein